MRYILKESQYRKLIFEISYDSNVEKIQYDLIYNKGYDLGNYGPKGDGVDGKAGRLTKVAFEKEFGKPLEISKLETSDKKDESNQSNVFDAVLIGGLDNRKGDYDIDTQVEFLKMGLGTNKKVKGFRYNTPISVIESFLEKNPLVPIFLFSAGCTKAGELSTNPNVNKKKLYIVEPFGSERNKNIIQSAVNNGVPRKNVFVGDSSGRGSGIISGANSSNSSSHWGALKKVGSLVNL